jgi:hypothetical protein
VIAAVKTETEKAAAKAAPAVSAIDQKFGITEQKEGLAKTLTVLTAPSGLLNGQKVILAYDTKLDPQQNTSDVVAIINNVIEKKTGAKQIIVVKGTGKELLDQVKIKRDALDRGQEKYTVITLAGDATLAPEQISEKEHKDLGRIINVKNNGDKQVPVIGLFDLALKIAYELGDENILRTLNRIALSPNGTPFTMDDLQNLLKKGFLSKPTRRQARRLSRCKHKQVY